MVGNGGGGYDASWGPVPATAAGIHYPQGITVDGAGNLYLSLFSQQLVCKVDASTGFISRIGGNGINGFSGDGGSALNASFSYPNGLAVNANGDVYVADYGNNRIRKIASTGIISTIAGNGIATFSGDDDRATKASLNLPTGVCIDNSGSVFIADRNNYVIRKINSAGIITTVAGSTNYGFGGDSTLATSACVKLADPIKVRVHSNGDIYISNEDPNGKATILKFPYKK